MDLAINRKNMLARQRYHERIELGICSKNCGRTALPGKTMCAECLNRQRQWQTAHRQELNEHKRQREREHIAAGLCRRCSAQAVKGKTLCDRCLAAKRVNKGG